MPTEPMVGTEFAGYRLNSVISRTNMSVVYTAEHPRLGHAIALKVLEERGIPTIGLKPKSLAQLMRSETKFDFVITTCEVKAGEKFCSPACGELASESQLRCDCGHPGCAQGHKG